MRGCAQPGRARVRGSGGMGCRPATTGSWSTEPRHDQCQRRPPEKGERAPAWLPAAAWRSWGALPTGSQLPTGVASSVAVRQEAGEEFLPKVWTWAARYAATRSARLVDLHCSHPAARSHKALTCSVATCVRGCHTGGQTESLVIHVGGSGRSSGASQRLQGRGTGSTQPGLGTWECAGAVALTPLF